MIRQILKLFVNIFSGILWLGLVVFVTGCTDPGSPLEGTISSLNRLEVYYSENSPRWDDPEDDIWDNALTGAIDLGKDGYPDDFDTINACLLKAVVANDSIFMRARWADFTRSIVPNPIILLGELDLDTTSTDPLVVDTSIIDKEWFRNPTISGDSWYDQDRFSLMWDMGDNGSEGADCLTMCHETGHPTSGDRMYTTGGGHVDVWQWLAAMSDPIFKTRDEYWSETGRASDAGDSLAISNYNAAKVQPFYAHSDGPTSVKILLYGDAVVEFDSTLTWLPGYSMPGYVLQKSVAGSTADISGFSYYSSSSRTWTVVMARPLNTGHADDIDLSQVSRGDSVMVSIAATNNADRIHSGSKPFYVIF